LSLSAEVNPPEGLQFPLGRDEVEARVIDLHLRLDAVGGR